MSINYKFSVAIAGLLFAPLLDAGMALAASPAATSPIAGKHRETTVSFANRDVRLEATLYLPDRPGKVPGIVLVHGAGPNGRASFKLVAAQLADAGYAVLNYDKRGVGGSSGTFPDKCGSCPDTLSLLADDASAALSYLATRPEVRKDRLGFWGVSQAGWIVPKAALMNRRASFMLLVSAPAISVHEVMKYGQLTNGKEVAGLTPDQAEERASHSDMVIDSPDNDPLPELRKLRIPALWLMGDQDWNVPPGRTIAIVRDLARGGKPYQARLIKGGVHLMAWVQPPGYWDAARTWLDQVTKTRR
jgi:dienelactone hydrolase